MGKQAFLLSVVVAFVCGFCALAQQRVTLVGLAFNPAGPTYQDGRLNPFSVPAIREAMNLVIDREKIVNEIYGGQAQAWFFPVFPWYLEGLGLGDVARTIAESYAYDFEKGKAVIFEEMQKLGAVLKDGVWNYQGKPVKVVLVVRTEDQRKSIGDYVAKQLRSLSLEVEVLYKTAREASPLVLTSNPMAGGWDIYTDGWAFLPDADCDKLFESFYTPRGRPSPLWEAYKPAEDLDRIARDLANKAYKSEEEHKSMVARALELCLKDSVRVWLVLLTL